MERLLMVETLSHSINEMASSSSNDTTNLTDINERRKAQNRVAQRKYRTRQKMRIEIAKAILLDRQHFQLDDRIGRSSRYPTLEPQATVHNVESTAVNCVAAKRAGNPTKNDTQDSIRVHGDPCNMPFDFEIEPELDVSTFDLSTTADSDYIDPELIQVDWMNDSCFSMSRSAIPPSPTPPLSCSATPIEPVAIASPPRESELVGTYPPTTTEIRNSREGDFQEETSYPSTRTSSLSTLSSLSSPSPFSVSQTPPTHATASPEPTSANAVGSAASSSSRPPTSSTYVASISPVSYVVAEPTNPLLTAISRGNLEIARLLIRSGAKIDAPDKNGKTPLHQAIERGDVKTTCALLDLGADVLKADSRGMGALHMAVEVDNKDIVRSLLEWFKGTSERGGDQDTGISMLNARNRQNMTAVHLSVSLERVEVLKVLLEYGADVNIGCD